jgi:hypothetical protein
MALTLYSDIPGDILAVDLEIYPPALSITWSILERSNYLRDRRESRCWPQRNRYVWSCGVKASCDVA